MNCWNRFFVEAEEMDIDFCCYISPFPSTMLTARHLHAAALPLKSYIYCPLRGRRSALPPSRYRSLKVGASKMPLRTHKTTREQPTLQIIKTNQPPPVLKNNLQKQTNTISRMRMAKDSIQIDRIKKVAIP